MPTVFEDAHQYLNSSIRTYVNATSTLDKLFAVKLIVLSMVIAADVLIEKMGSSSDTSFHGHLEDSDFFLPMAAYEKRITDLQIIETGHLNLVDPELSLRMHKSIETLKFVYGKYGFRTLLSLNLKEFINDALFFILDIQEIVEKNNPSQQDRG
ncbi:MAG: hypothetical protein ACTSR4_04270 [Candidatus Hodarchaeales archaeon]